MNNLQFVEQGKYATYFAFNAPESDIQEIESIFHSSGVMSDLVKVKKSFRPAGDGCMYTHYARVKKSAPTAKLVKLFRSYQSGQFTKSINKLSESLKM